MMIRDLKKSGDYRSIRTVAEIIMRNVDHFSMLDLMLNCG